MKHQSAWDTLILLVLFGDPASVLKRELLFVPFYGWYAARAGSISVDRKAGSSALRRLVTAARPAAAQGRPIVIFPEGTRVGPGVRLPYLSGVAALYQALALPLVPAAVIPVTSGDDGASSNARAGSFSNSSSRYRPAGLVAGNG